MSEIRMDLRKSYFSGKYIQGNEAIKELPSLIDLYGGKAFIMVTPSMEKMAIENGFADKHFMEVFRGPCCWQEINRLIDVAKNGDYTVVVGIGGGKVVDTAKVVADKLNLRVIMVPTVASSSAPFSACSVIYTPEDIAESVYYEKHSPDVLLVDNKLIIGANLRYFVAGMADALTTFYEGRGCTRTGSPNSLHSRQTFLAMATAEYCKDALLEYGEAAKIAYEAQVITPALERVIEINLLGAGIAFEGTGLASSHAIHNGLTILPETHNALHGELVAFGILCELILTDSDPDEINQIYSFCEKLNLPTTFAQLGIGGISKEKLMDVAVATFNDPYLHHEGKNITVDEIYAAMVAADALGQARKKES